MTEKEKTRKEVERLINELIQERGKYYSSDVDDACILELQNVLTYIDSLQEEPVSENMEEATKHYLYSNILYDDVYVGNPTDKDCIEMFKAGANWQKEKLEEQYELIQSWFEHIEQIATDRMTLTGQRMTDAHALNEIKCLAKNSSEFITKHYKAQKGEEV